MKKDKRGFLLAEETLKIILAVIAIGFLAYFLFSLYNANKDAKDLELAEGTLNHLMQEIGAERTEVEIYNPKGWIISSWSSELPQSCFNLGWESCICICKNNLLRSSELNECNIKGACLENPQKFEINPSIKIKDPPITLSISNKIISKK